MDHVIYDFIGKLRVSERGYCFILIMVCVMTCFVFLKPLRTKRRRTTRERKRGTIKTQKRNLKKSSFSFEELLSQPSQYPNKEIPSTQQHEHPPR